MIERKKTKQITLGGVAIGGDAPVVVQSMCNTLTHDIPATLNQINALATAGCQLARLAVPDTDAAQALPKLVKKSPLPLIADIHFDYKLALAAIDAGVPGLRLNPGNIGGADKVKQVVKAAAAQNIPIRIGVNGGSLEKPLLQKYGVSAQALVESALGHVRILEDLNFDQIKISVKTSSVPLTIQAYRLLSEKVDYPLHLGVTEAGTEYEGTVKSAVGIGTLLAEGIGDTIRVSLTGDPVQEVVAGLEILKALDLRQGLRVVSCPTCGRTRIDLITLAHQVKKALLPYAEHNLTVAVMGCVVNGPGEAREADYGVAGGIDEGLLFKKGRIVAKLPQTQLLTALLDLINNDLRT